MNNPATTPSSETQLLAHFPDIAKAIDLYNECLRAATRGDDEDAHVAEDRLRAFALECVTVGRPQAMNVARIALSTSNIDFARRCA